MRPTRKLLYAPGGTWIHATPTSSNQRHVRIKRGDLITSRVFEDGSRICGVYPANEQKKAMPFWKLPQQDGCSMLLQPFNISRQVTQCSLLHTSIWTAAAKVDPTVF